MAKQPVNQTLNITRYEYRLIYSKTDRARYISHLDLMRTMQRTFKRAGLPLWYTQGFNPHAYLMFPLALSLGTDSEVEYLDIALTEELDFDEIKNRTNEKIPMGLKIINVAKPVMKHTEIGSAKYEICLETNVSAQETAELFREFLSKEKIEIEKKSKKKGINLVDIKPHIQLDDLKVLDEKTIIALTLPAGNQFNLNTSVVIDAFKTTMNLEVESQYTKRTKIMAQNGENFI